MTNRFTSLKNKKYQIDFVLIIIFFLYVGLRLISWSNLTGLEDHDSIQYLKLTEFFTNFTFEGLLKLGPDDLILYPFLSSLLTPLGISIELSARLLTFITSIVLFFVVFSIQKKLWGRNFALIGNLILSLNPFLITFSYSVLTEPLYILIIYITILYFIDQVKSPSIKSGVVLGIIIGLSFIARTEGVIFLVAIPIMQLIHFLVTKHRNYEFTQFLKWSAVFALLFSLVVMPQVLRVSNKMGTFAINGRQAWMKVLKSDINKSTDEKIYGLDFNPSQINIHHVQNNPEVFNSLKSETNLSAQIKSFIYTFNELYNIKLSNFFGLLGIIFFGLGILYLIISRKTFDILFIAFFTAVCIFPPLLHNVVTRHIAILGPIFIMVQALGIIYLSNTIREKYSKLVRVKYTANSLALVFVVISSLLTGHSLYMSLFKPTTNTEYIKSDFDAPIKILHQDIKNTSPEKVVLVSRKGYFPYFAGIEYISTPYSTYDKFVEYLRLNQARYIFIEYQTLSEFPFINNFLENNTPDFILLDSRFDSMGNKIELYKFSINNIGLKQVGK